MQGACYPVIFTSAGGFKFLTDSIRLYVFCLNNLEKLNFIICLHLKDPLLEGPGHIIGLFYV